MNTISDFYRTNRPTRENITILNICIIKKQQEGYLTIVDVEMNWDIKTRQYVAEPKVHSTICTFYIREPSIFQKNTYPSKQSTYVQYLIP